MMRCMRRTIIYLEDGQIAEPDRRAAAQGMSRAELVRRLIDRALGRSGQSPDEDLAESFGALAGTDIVIDRSPDVRQRHLDQLLEA